MLHALSALPVRVLMTIGAGGEVAPADVPGNAHVEQFWPQDDVMPLAAAVVGHGGFGTTLSALSAGVPQVVVPLFSSDQHLNAEAISALGAGVTIHGGPQAAPDMAAAVYRRHHVTPSVLTARATSPTAGGIQQVCGSAIRYA